MDTSNILKPTAVQNQSLTGKTLRLLSAWLLAEVVLNSAILKFVERLNEKGILGMGANFSANQLFWGDGFLLNTLRLFIVVFFAGVFGFLYGYLSRKVSASEKVIVNAINMIMAVFGAAVLFLLAVAIFHSEQLTEVNNTFGIMLHMTFSSPFYIGFIILNLLGSFAFGFYCVGLGMRTVNHPYHPWDKEKTGTLLEIKWYHYLWLWMPLGFYSQVAINLIYATGHALVTFFRNVRWFEFLGASVAAEGVQEQNSIDVAWGKLIGIYIAVVIIYYLLAYLREILAGEKKMHWALKTLISIGIGIALPALLTIYTVLGG